MQDEKIVALYWERDESAIRATEEKYGAYLTKIAYNILANIEDSKESVNDTYLGAWHSMPPNKPNTLSTYLAKITRRTSIDIFRKRSTEKRKVSEYSVSLDELGDCVSAGDSPEQTVELQLLADTIAAYLQTLPQMNRNVFLQRYYFLDPVQDIADYYGVTKSKIEGMLHRIRKGLKTHLEREGFAL